MPAEGDRAEAAGDGRSPRDVTSGYLGRRERRRGTRNRNSRSDRGNTFQGPLAGYETVVYDISRNKGGDAFGTVTRKLAEYVVRTVKNGGEFLNSMNPRNLGFTPLVEPEDLDDDATPMQIRRWDHRYGVWQDKKKQEGGVEQDSVRHHLHAMLRCPKGQDDDVRRVRRHPRAARPY